MVSRGPALLLLTPAWLLVAFDSVPPESLISLARTPSNPAFTAALTENFAPRDLEQGLAFATFKGEALFAANHAADAELYIDDQPVAHMRPTRASGVSFALVRLTTGRGHKFYYVTAGRRWGGVSLFHQRGPGPDVPSYGEECYPRQGVPPGVLSAPFTTTSRIYPHMVSRYWIYQPAHYDPKVPTAVMIWQDGELHVDRNGPQKTLTVIDNLMAEKKLPVMIHVFLAPGFIGEKRMRSVEYDVVDDTYARFLHDEILPEVRTRCPLRNDSYSIGLWGYSSSGDASFTAAWYHPEWFSRIQIHISSFTSIQWKPGIADGAYILPFLVRKNPKRNIRIWMQDGSDNSENEHGSWPLMNLEMANSLKLMGYDFHMEFGNGTHSLAQANAQMPESLTWLWRDYDASKTEQVYEMEPAEKDKPLFRVRIYNRD